MSFERIRTREHIACAGTSFGLFGYLGYRGVAKGRFREIMTGPTSGVFRQCRVPVGYECS